jgi:hypothetical protein
MPLLDHARRAIEVIEHNGFVEYTARDNGTVLRLRGPYNVPAVDFWPTTGTCRQVGLEGAPVHRGAGVTFAVGLAFFGSARAARTRTNLWRGY